MALGYKVEEKGVFLNEAIFGGKLCDNGGYRKGEKISI
jgi:hypothetical protein